MSESSKPVRIHKFLAEQGVCSRRQAEAWIRDGLVSVNGQPAAIGQPIIPGKDVIKAHGKIIAGEPQRKISLVMNKPKGLLCTNHDPEGGSTVFDILPAEYRKLRLFCCGRLDKDSEGLLVLTNDGAFKQKLTHPSSGIVKRYLVTVNRPIDPAVTAQFLKGVNSEGETLIARKVVSAKSGPNKERRVEIHLDQGRKREIRRMFEAFGYFVKELKRIQIGSFVLRKLGVGAARLLTKKEQELLLRPSATAEPLPAARKFSRPMAPTARERRYALQKEESLKRNARKAHRPFSKSSLENAREGENILERSIRFATDSRRRRMNAYKTHHAGKSFPRKNSRAHLD